QLMDDDAVAVGVGVAGMVEFPEGVVRYGPNLPFRELPLRQWLEHSTGLPCLVDNDANSAGWGEHLHGAGRDAGDMLLVAVGTGIGGAGGAGGGAVSGGAGGGCRA